MRYRFTFKFSCKHYASVFVAIMLFSSLGFHTVQISHEHFGNHHTHNGEHESPTVQLSDVMHLYDKKLLITIPVLLVSLWAIFNSLSKLYDRLLFSACAKALSVLSKNREQFRFYLYLTQCFSKGILHTKVY